MDLFCIFVYVLQVSLALSTIQPDDGTESLDVIFAEVANASVYGSIDMPCINHQDVIFSCFFSSFVEKPQSAGKGARIEKICSHRHDDVDVACFDDLLTNGSLCMWGIGC